MNEKNLFKIDTRLDSRNSAADRKAYASNFKFTTMTTNEAGNILFKEIYLRTTSIMEILGNTF